ncbi:MAG: hypothetical protein K0Q47_44 [Sedimentibacter sp.]|jgi:hypothetical protein|nr:hypothetical protein [Sedimentibacter sp.]
MEYQELRSLKAKKGNAELKKRFLKQWSIAHGALQLCIIHDPYNVREELEKEMLDLELKLKQICH